VYNNVVQKIIFFFYYKQKVEKRGIKVCEAA